LTDVDGPLIMTIWIARARAFRSKFARRFKKAPLQLGFHEIDWSPESARMKLYRAAALALVGWYLMSPPVNGDSPATAFLKRLAPLSEWDIVDSYDTAAECRKARKQYAEDIPNTLSSAKATDNGMRITIDKAQGAKCIATDDPRLKGN